MAIKGEEDVLRRPDTAQLERERADHNQACEELKNLKELHAEEVRVHSGIEFRRGKRTGGNWIAFCPVCQTPVDMSSGILRCASPKCKWQILFPANKIAETVAKL
jgi:hypothetical protein